MKTINTISMSLKLAIVSLALLVCGSWMGQAHGLQSTAISGPVQILQAPGSGFRFYSESETGINSKYAMLVRLQDGEVLLNISGESRMYPASMTKIMTVYLALEYIDDLDVYITLGEEMFSGIYAANASTAGFQPGERVRALDLMYASMLPSGAEASIGLAEYIAGSEAAYAQLMNQKAQELGMAGTNFVNVTGLHHANHYSTAKDMAALLTKALQNSTFREIVTTSRYSTGQTNLHPDGITFGSTLFAGMDSPEFNGGVILGGKTGYTHEAGQCLASLARLGSSEYILVTSGAMPENRYTQQLHIDDAFTIYQKYGAKG